MTRLLLNLLTALSLLLWAAVAVLWVRSHFDSDRFLYTPLTVRPEGFRTGEYVVDTCRGVLGIGVIRHDFDRATMPAPLYDAHLINSLSRNAESAGGWRRRPGLPMDPAARDRLPLQHAQG